MSDKTKFTVNSSTGIKDIGSDVYMIECKYINPGTSEYITGNVILSSKDIKVFSRGCQTSVDNIEHVMGELPTFDIDAQIVGEYALLAEGTVKDCPAITDLFMMDMRN